MVHGHCQPLPWLPIIHPPNSKAPGPLWRPERGSLAPQHSCLLHAGRVGPGPLPLPSLPPGPFLALSSSLRSTSLSLTSNPQSQCGGGDLGKVCFHCSVLSLS